MDGLLVLGDALEVSASSAYRDVAIDDLWREIARRSGWPDGGESMASTFPSGALASALERRGRALSDGFGDRTLEAILSGREDGERDARTTATLAALCVLCGGATEVKVGLVFRSIDVDRVGGITSDQAVAFASECASVVGAVMEDAGRGGADLGWAVAQWTELVKKASAEAEARGDLGMFTLVEFKALLKRMFAVMSRSSLGRVDSESAARRESDGVGGRRRRSLSGTSPARVSQSSVTFLDAPIVQTGLAYLERAAGAAGHASGAGRSPAENILSAVVGAVSGGSQSPIPGEKSARTEDKSIVVSDLAPLHRSTGSSGSANWSSVIPDGIAQLLGVKSPQSTHVLKREEGMTDEEWEHAKLASEVEAARKETDETELTQAVEESSWSNLVMLVKELAVRLFLFNTVRLLLTIALLGGDAALCVYVIGHFGVVAGLGFVVIINVVLSVIFIWFIINFNKRERGKDNMQFGAKLVQGIQDVAKTRAAFDGMLHSPRGDSDLDHASPRSWQLEDEPTPRAFGALSNVGDDRRFRRTVSGTALGERV